MKLILFFVLLLLYPLFLHWVNIHDYRVVPLVIPYALGVLSITIMLMGMAEFIMKKLRG